MTQFRRLFGFLCCAAMACAQTAPIRRGSFEVGGFAGATYGVSQAAPMGGGNISYAVTKMFLPYVEYSYFPNIQRQASGSIGSTTNTFSSASYSTNASDFHVGVHLRFPIRESRLAPYGAFGVGSLTVGSFTIQTLTYSDANGTHSIPGPFHVSGISNAAINFGGGIRYYTTPRFGLRLEVKGYKPFNGQDLGLGSVHFNNPFLKAEAGFFFQFK